MKTAKLVSAAALAGFAGFIAASSAQASSPDAWKQFNTDVEKKCGDAAANFIRKPQVAIDPIGSESFGLAIVYGKAKEAKGRIALVCVVNKKTGTVELGTEMGNDIVRVRKPKSDDKDDGGDE